MALVSFNKMPYVKAEPLNIINDEEERYHHLVGGPDNDAIAADGAMVTVHITPGFKINDNLIRVRRVRLYKSKVYRFIVWHNHYGEYMRYGGTWYRKPTECIDAIYYFTLVMKRTKWIDKNIVQIICRMVFASRNDRLWVEGTSWYDLL